MKLLSRIRERFLLRQNGYPSLDYSAFSALLQKNMPYAEAIDLMPVLSLNSYYRTDLHWRQEAIVPVASQLAEAMGVKLSEKYDTVTADTPFYGVYYGQVGIAACPRYTLLSDEQDAWQLHSLRL